MSARAARARRERVGILGGTFDPPHVGHLAIAECARSQLRLDRVLFAPAGEPPHKRGRARASVRDRLAMTRLAVRGNRAFAVTTLEVERAGPSYTVETLRALAAAHPRASWVLIVGADMFATLGHWREPRAIAALATIAVAPRPGVRRARAGAWARGGRGVVWLDAPALEIASSALRARLAAGASVRYLVPDAVVAYAARRRLYRRGARR